MHWLWRWYALRRRYLRFSRRCRRCDVSPFALVLFERFGRMTWFIVIREKRMSGILVRRFLFLILFRRIMRPLSFTVVSRTLWKQMLIK